MGLPWYTMTCRQIHIDVDGKVDDDDAVARRASAAVTGKPKRGPAEVNDDRWTDNDEVDGVSCSGG